MNALVILALIGITLGVVSLLAAVVTSGRWEDD